MISKGTNILKKRRTMIKKTEPIQKTFLLFLFLIGTTAIQANPKSFVSGQVKNKQTKSPIEFCTVRVFNTSDSLINGATTDEKGFFSIDLPQGTYIIKTSYIGYQEDSRKIEHSGKDTFLGTIWLETESKDIEEVVIQGESSETKLDKDVYVVTDKLKVGAASAKDVLSKVQGVYLDRYNNKLMIDGSDKIVFLVNGLEKDQEYIQSMDPKRLQKIEVIRDPGGKYGLDGYTAVVNIKLKDNYRGFEVSVNGGGLIDIDRTGSHKLFPANWGSASVNYTQNRWNIYARSSGHRHNMHMNRDITKNYTSGLNIYESPINNNSNGAMIGSSLRNTLGADFIINPKHTISFEAFVKGYPGKDDHEYEAKMIYTPLSGIQSRTDIFSKEHISEKYHQAKLFYMGKISPKLSIESNVFFSWFKDESENNYRLNADKPRIETGYNEGTRSRIFTELTYNLDPKTSFQAGYRWTDKQRESNTKIKNPSGLSGASDAEHVFNYNDRRQVAYLYFSRKLGTKMSVKTGLAMEHNRPSTPDYTPKTFIGWQPYLNLKYKPLKVLDLLLKYRAYNRYTSLSQTNPLEVFVDKQSVRKGNPNLSPAMQHRISLQMKVMQGLFSLEPFYKFSRNNITEVMRIRTDGITEYSYDNNGTYDTYGSRFSLTVPLYKQFLILQNSGKVYYERIEYKKKEHHLTDWELNSQLVFLYNDWGLTTGGMYQRQNSKNINSLGYRMYNNDYWGLFAQKTFFDNRLNIMLAYVLPIEWGAKMYQEEYKETDSYRELAVSHIDVLKNILIFNISFRFNKGKITKVSKGGNDDNENSQGGMKLF